VIALDFSEHVPCSPCRSGVCPRILTGVNADASVAHEDHGQPVVTLIVHGTYAAEELWWRLGTSSETFADRLERALAERGLSGSVWRGALAGGLGYGDFSWTGANRDKDRRNGGKKLAASLEQLARQAGANPEKPLVVNLVAHSHGGNVVLDALPRLSPRVQVGRIVLLGTPLLSVRPSFRIMRLSLASVMGMLLSVFAVYLLFVPLCLGCAIFGGCSFCDSMDSGGFKPWAMAPLLLLVAAFYRWFLLFFAFAADLVWQILFSPWMRFQRWAQVYGPRASTLRQYRLKAPIVLISCDDDEAGLLLQLGAGPRRLYEEYVKARLGRMWLAAEWLFARPIVTGLLLRATEVLLERLVLGFGWMRVLFFDYEVVDLKRGREYPPEVLARIDVTDELPVTATPRARLRDSAAPPAMATAAVLPSHRPPGVQPVRDKRAESLLMTLQLVREHLVSQVKLRHSLYYESEPVLRHVADSICGKAPGPSRAAP
jgi:hypothetical protein